MTEKITEEMLEQIRILSQLKLTEEERISAKADMEVLLIWLEQMKKLDTSDTEPLVHLYNYPNVLREDIAGNPDGSEELLNHIPDRKGEYIQVPNTINGKVREIE